MCTRPAAGHWEGGGGGGIVLTLLWLLLKSNILLQLLTLAQGLLFPVKQPAYNT